MTRPMNIVLLVVDSLRAAALDDPALPFFARLARQSIDFRRAYATECWTLPAHLSLFTGLLPSQHGAHFQHMAYAAAAPTIAELLAAEGYRTEIVTRNSIFDGSLPGVTRGFQRNTRILASRSGVNALSLVLAASKPRFRRQVRSTGFFHARQRDSAAFVRTFAQATVPADREALAYVLEKLADARRRREPTFLFANLYDVHAPYSPSPESIFRRPWWSRRGLDDLVRLAVAMPKLGGHRYLRRGFRMSDASRRMLLDRYRDAVRLMDGKLAAFYDAARSAGLLDETLLIVTSDHGEAFGEHGLYLHDASVYDTHLHVPLFVHHPQRAAEVVHEVVSSRDLFALMRAVGTRRGVGGTLLDPAARAARPVALAEHFHYDRLPDALPQYRRNLTAAIAGDHKVIASGDGVRCYDLARDRGETTPTPAPLAALDDVARGWGIDARARHAVRVHCQRVGALVGSPCAA